MNNILLYPESCHVDRVIPKNAFYRNADMTKRMRNRFVDELQELRWLYKLAPQTLNVEKGKDIEEIQIFHANLKQTAVPVELLQFIDKVLPQFIIFILQSQNNYCLLGNYKKFATQAHDRCEIIETFCTEWATNTPPLLIQGRTLPQIYENFIRQIAGKRLAKSTTFAEDLAEMQRREAIMKQIEQLEALMNKEVQSHRKFELHQQIQKLKNTL